MTDANDMIISTNSAFTSRPSQVAAFPTIVFWLTAVIILGGIAHFAAISMIGDPPNRDMWQHAAAIRELMTNLTDPSNPFVVSGESSRHFHPLWVLTAIIANQTGTALWDALFYLPYISMALFAGSVFFFARTYFSQPWAPVVLLITFLFGWGLQLGHTGFHNVFTIAYAAAYPATFMISFSLILWALCIRSLSTLRLSVLLVPLCALMFATHQFGAVIGFIGAGSFVLLWPNVAFRHRAIVATAMLAGILVSFLWPYHNPLMLVLQRGNSTWEGGPDFYSVGYLLGAFVPQILGLMGLITRKAWPLAFALLCYVALYSLGKFDFQIAARFLMPAVLILQIGMVAFLFQLLSGPKLSDRRKKALAIGTVVYFACLFGVSAHLVYRSGFHEPEPEVSVYEASLRLTADIPDTEPVAAYYITSWPITATGQRVHSVPWPEPGISDLAERQSVIQTLFETQLSQSDRMKLLQEHGMKTMLTDTRLLPDWMIESIRGQAVRTTQAGSIVRMDFFE